MMNESEIYGEDSRVKWLDKIMNETQLRDIIRNRHRTARPCRGTFDTTTVVNMVEHYK